MKNSSTLALTLLLPFLMVSCTEELPTTTVYSVEDEAPSMAKVTDLVSVAGADVCPALGFATGCDKNFSLAARVGDDGSVGGEWQDGFERGDDGIHVAIDCVNIVGNGAVIGGVITKGTRDGVDVSGQRALTAAVDNGSSSNDPPDQISFSVFPTGANFCTSLVPDNFPLFDLLQGQVVVR